MKLQLFEFISDYFIFVCVHIIGTKFELERKEENKRKMVLKFLEVKIFRRKEAATAGEESKRFLIKIIVIFKGE